MSIFNWLANFIKGLKTPKWLADMLQYLTEKVLYPTLEALGEEVKNLLTSLIITASHKDWPGDKMFKWVVSEFKERWGGEEIKDRLLNLGVELILAILRKQGIIG